MINFLAKPFNKNCNPIIYLHVGINKTGTTFIQSYFSRFRSELAQAGILYPRVGLVGSAHYSLSASLGFCHKTVPGEWMQDVKILKKQFNKELNNHEGPVVFSSEDFSLNKPIRPVVSFFDGFDLRVVVYLRRHDHWWLSAYAQAAKMKRNPPWKLGVQPFINFNRRRNKQYGNYRFLLDRWASILGKDNIIVRPYEAGQNQPNLVFDFLRTIDSSCDLRTFPNELDSKNRSLPLKAVQYLDIFQRVRTNDLNYSKLIDYAKSQTSESRVSSLLSPEFRLRLIEDNSSDYEYIAREYLGRDDGRLFYESMPQLDDEWEYPVWPTSSEVAEAVIEALSR